MQDVQDAIGRLPPEAWPLIDTLYKITIALVLIWLALSLIAWWRRRAYNLTVASTASRSKKAQPDFLSVDKNAREAAIARGAAHEEFLEERERQEALAALRAAGGPTGLGQRIAGLAAFAMSLFTLATVIFGTVTNISKMGDALESVSSIEKIQMVVSEHLLGTILALLVIGWHLYRYFAGRKWKEA